MSLGPVHKCALDLATRFTVRYYLRRIPSDARFFDHPARPPRHLLVICVLVQVIQFGSDRIVARFSSCFSVTK